MREQSQLLKQIPPPAEIGRELARVLAEAAALRTLLRASKKLHPKQVDGQREPKSEARDA
jgi:hypothetical protein